MLNFSDYSNKILQGDIKMISKQLPDAIANCIITSPPYFNLRDYGMKAQIGLERTPEQYINSLVKVFRELKRVLKKDGTLWINISDSYNSNIGGYKNQSKPFISANTAAATKRTKKSIAGIKAKDLIGIPWMLAFALRKDGWYWRDTIIWANPNPMPESVTDRTTKSHEYILLFSKKCIDLFGVENVRVIFIDTRNEDDDTYRFLSECENWYGCKIETIASDKYDNIEDIWYDNLTLGLAKGAKCSAELKIVVRQQFTKRNKFSYQAFGYDNGEVTRANDMKNSNPHLRPIFPLLMFWMSKFDCVKYVQDANNLFISITLPITYRLGLENNNCFKTGCVQGGIGYWQWMQNNQPTKFDEMAVREHEITDLKGVPVTICKDQSKGGGLVFLKPHPKYLHMKDISMMKGRPPEMLMECNGFCNVVDNK